jgi:hypothetical protein
MASTYLSKTFSSAGNRKTWTYSTWVKISGIGSQNFFATTGADSSNRVQMNIEGSGKFNVECKDGGSTTGQLLSTRLFRDCNAWYHFVIAFDTTQATSSNRIKIYVNGVQLTAFDTETYPSQNAELQFNKAQAHNIGKRTYATTYFDGYMAHTHFTDGTQYAASDFGETESTSGIWKPKTSPSITYGTNGFFLKFQDSSSLGDDSSGNTNDFTLNGSGRQILDTPSNVFATMNAVNGAAGSDYTLTNGNTTFGRTSSGNRAGFATLGVQTGKWYWEVEASAIGGGAYIGISKESNTYNSQAGSSQYAGSESGDIGYKSSDGNKVIGGTSTSYGNSYTTGDIIGVALDLDNDKLYFSKNGTWQNSGVPTSGATGTGAISITNSDYVWFASSSGQTNVVLEHNFGNGYFGTTAVASAENDDAGHGKFEYDVPAGYYALCTKNINTYG